MIRSIPGDGPLSVRCRLAGGLAVTYLLGARLALGQATLERQPRAGQTMPARRPSAYKAPLALSPGPARLIGFAAGSLVAQIQLVRPERLLERIKVGPPSRDSFWQRLKL